MKSWIILGGLVLGWATGFCQTFDLVDKQDSYQSAISQTLRIPIHIRNSSDKAQFYIVRKVQDDLNTTQKGYFCLDKNCLEPTTSEFSKKVEAGETLQNLFFTLETGLLSGQHTLRFEVYPMGQAAQAMEHTVSIVIDEHLAKAMMYHSREITIHDVYPNPVTDLASIEYNIHSEGVKAKVVIHNILGKPLGDYELPASDNKIKIPVDELPAGVYFYTLYVNNEGVFTRKLMVRK